MPIGWYLAFVRRHRWLLTIAVLAGLLAGTALVVHRGKVYTATVEVIASKAPLGSNELSGAQRVQPSTVDTEAQLLQSGPVLQATAKALGHGRTAGDVRKALQVTVPQGTRSIIVQYRSGDEPTARHGAAQMSQQYLALRTRLIVTQRDRQIASLATYLDALQRNESAGRGQNGVAAGSVRAAERRVVRELQDLRAAPVDPGELVTHGAPTVVSTLPNASVPLTSGALLGMLAAVLLALAGDARRQRIHTVEDALAICPAQLVTRVAVERLDRPVRDRRLRNVVLLGWSDGARVTVTGAGRRVGPAVAQGLAEELAAVTDRAWLVHDGVARRPAAPSGAPATPIGASAAGSPAGVASPQSWLVVADDVDSTTSESFLTRHRVDLVVLPVLLGRTTRRQLRRAYAWRYDPRAPVALVAVRRARRHRLRVAVPRRRPGAPAAPVAVPEAPAPHAQTTSPDR
ncbi:MAG: hypothetical protein ACJ74O_16405 [Frankiaceae bacterium]